MTKNIKYKIVFKNKTEQIHDELSKETMMKVLDHIISNGSLMDEIESIVITG